MPSSVLVQWSLFKGTWAWHTSTIHNPKSASPFSYICNPSLTLVPRDPYAADL